MSIRPTRDGGYVIAGRSNSPRGNTDILLMRTDGRFDPLWTKTFGGPGLDQGFSAVELPDESIVIVGVIDVDNLDHELFVARVDASSKLLWSRHFGGPGSDDAREVVALPDNSVVIVGTYDHGAAVTDLWLFRVDAHGDSIWSKTFDIRGSDRGRSIALCPDGGAIVSCQVEGLDSVKFVQCLVRFDRDFNEVWRNTYSGINRDEPAQVIPVSDGGFVLVGSTNFKPTFRPPHFATTLLKTDAAGTALWYHEYSLNANDEGFSVVEIPQGGFLLTGTALTDFYASDNQLAVIRTDAGGVLQWVRYYGGNDTEVGQSVIRIAGGFAIAGYTQSYGSGRSDIYCLQIDNNGQLDH